MKHVIHNKIRKDKLFEIGGVFVLDNYPAPGYAVCDSLDSYNKVMTAFRKIGLEFNKRYGVPYWKGTVTRILFNRFWYIDLSGEYYVAIGKMCY